MLSAFTLVRNAVKLNFPIVATIYSVLGVADEVVVNVGKSDDRTHALIASIADPRVRIIESDWHLSRGDDMLAHETQRALDACRGDWAIYIQADEVLHEDGGRLLREAVAACDDDPRVEGLLVNYLHFYGDFHHVATDRRWYRREVRCIRVGADIRPYQGAQGFRVGPELRKIRARPTDAVMFHYGWARPAYAMREKLAVTKQMYPWAADRLEREERRGALPWMPLIRRFAGTHPLAAQDWIAECAAQPSMPIEPAHFRTAHLRYYVSDWFERRTGVRPFEFRNYTVV